MLEEKIISATIKEGDDIAAVTFFAAKPQKKGKFAISLQQSEEGGDNYRLLLQYNVPTFFAMQLFSRTIKGNCSCAAPQQAKEKKTKQEGDAVVTFFATVRCSSAGQRCNATLQSTAT
jgi:hypothetical protein